MERYRNLEGTSPILGYEIGRGFIKVWFEGSAVPYRYRTHLRELKRLATQGKGLSTFISQNRNTLPFTHG